ncbi:MAG TPA: hypothetical protein VK436_14230 [Methanocella sp.]|nr:hypothetical protein [Methanocella sp.]
MRYRLLSGIIVITVVVGALAMSGCISSFDKSVTSTTKEKIPSFIALRDNNTTVTIMLVDSNGVKDIKGLHVVSPSINSPDVIDPNTSVPSGKTIKVTDSGLSGKVNLVVTTSVNGTSITVLNGTV